MLLDYKKQIDNLMAGLLSKENFLKQVPFDFDQRSTFILDLFELSLAEKDQVQLDYTIPLIGFDSNFRKTEKYVDVLCRLLMQDWHFRHEDIVSLLQGIKSPKSVDAIYKAALTEFEYLGYDETFSLARKCIHALGAINSDLAKEKLKILANSEIPIIKEKALRQLENLM